MTHSIPFDTDSPRADAACAPTPRTSLVGGDPSSCRSPVTGPTAADAVSVVERRCLFSRAPLGRRTVGDGPPAFVDQSGAGSSRDERGQGTVEYALVLLAAAALALVVVAWVSRTDTIGRLFDTVVDSILGRVV